MIVLLAGASHSGKTYLAQRLLQKYQFPYFSIDHLKMGLIRSGMTDLTPMDDDKLTDYLWSFVFLRMFCEESIRLLSTFLRSLGTTLEMMFLSPA